jgi:hypothetical protein
MSYYPSFQTEYTHEELVEHFWLHSEEIEFVESFRSQVNKQTVAVLLKSLEYLGGFPESLEQIPEQVRIFIANQFNLLWDYTPNYLWESSIKLNICRRSGSLPDGVFRFMRTKQHSKAG